MPLPNNESQVNVPKAPPAKSADDVLDILNTVDDEIPPEDKTPARAKPDKEDEPPPDDKEDDELELVEPDEEVEKLDLTKEDDDLTIDAPPRKKEILKEYPELFKKFPFIEKMLYRDRQYNELFGSFDDAKEAHERAENFSEIEKQLLAGSTEQLLRDVKESDERAYNIIVDDYLTTLAKVDREAYLHVTGNLNKRLIMEMVAEAKESDNKELQEAAVILHQFIFGNSKFEPPKSRVDRSSENNEEKNKIEQERIAHEKERFEEARDTLQTRVDNTLRATVSEYIDPRGNMSSYVKKNAINDAMRYLGELINQDKSVQKNLDRLWRAAYENRYSRDSTGKIQSYYLSRAKANLKQAIMKARTEALKDRPANRDKETDDETREEREETPALRRRIQTGRPAPARTEKGQMKKGESVTDFFMRD